MVQANIRFPLCWLSPVVPFGGLGSERRFVRDYLLTVMSLYLSRPASGFPGRAGLQARGALHDVHWRCRPTRTGQAAHRQGLHGGPVEQDGEYVRQDEMTPSESASVARIIC